MIQKREEIYIQPDFKVSLPVPPSKLDRMHTDSLDTPSFQKEEIILQAVQQRQLKTRKLGFLVKLQKAYDMYMSHREKGVEGQLKIKPLSSVSKTNKNEPLFFYLFPAGNLHLPQ